MREATATAPFDPPLLGATRDNRTFNVALVFAVGLHALTLIGFVSARPRQLGDPRGTPEAISVSFVTEADLKARSTVPDTAAGPLAAPAPVTEPAPPAAKEPAAPVAKETAPEPPEPQTQSEPAEISAPEETPKASAQQTQGPEPAPAEKKAEPDRTPAKTPAEPDKPREANPKPRKPSPTTTAKLDLSAPPVVFAAPGGGGGAGVQRPPGITRSGENDAFARGVIRALQATMPQLRETFGRVTVRITLDKNGNLFRTDVLRPSQVAGLDQSVVFATRQTSFPLPPLNANSADLVFIVTYIYR